MPYSAWMAKQAASGIPPARYGRMAPAKPGNWMFTPVSSEWRTWIDGWVWLEHYCEQLVYVSDDINFYGSNVTISRCRTTWVICDLPQQVDVFDET